MRTLPHEYRRHLVLYLARLPQTLAPSPNRGHQRGDRKVFPEDARERTLVGC